MAPSTTRSSTSCRTKRSPGCGCRGRRSSTGASCCVTSSDTCRRTWSLLGLRSGLLLPGLTWSPADMRFVKKFTRPDFHPKIFTQLKVHALRLFLLTIKQCKCISIRNLGSFLFNYTKCVKNKQFKSKITLSVCQFCSYT